MADGSIEKRCRYLIDKFGGYVKAIVVNRIGGIGTREDVEDCISDVFAEIFRDPKGLPEDDAEIKALLGTIAKRRAIDHFRRLTYHDGNTDHADEETMVRIPTTENTEEETEKRAMQRLLWDSVESLGEPDSSIIVYQYFYRRKAGEIARLLSMTTAAVNKRSQRARQRLREILLKQGYTE